MARFMDSHEDLKLPTEARQDNAVDEPASETASSWRRSERAWTANIVQSLPLRRSPSLR